jgi:hypothetical protein
MGDKNVIVYQVKIIYKVGWNPWNIW